MDAAKTADTTLVTPLRQFPEIALDGERAFFLHPATRLRYGVNASAHVILDALAAETTVGEITRHVESEFRIDPAEARKAVIGVVMQMAELGFVTLHRQDDSAARLRSRYLELLRRALVNLIYPEHELRIERLEAGGAAPDGRALDRELRDIRYGNDADYAALIAAKGDGAVWRGRPWRFSHTMVGMRRLEHLQWCAERVFEEAVPGDFLEAGVCQGGASILLRALQVAFDQPHRKTWLADSFQGLPIPEHENDQGYDFSETKQPWLAMTEEAVADNFRTYDLLSDEVVFLPGWFRDSLPGAQIPQLAILRVDADLYESTLEVLTALYDHVSPGGFIVIDDYNAFTPCRRAVTEFRAERDVTEPIRMIDRMAVYWRKRL